MRGKRPIFSREFKLEAVRLLDEGKKPSAELARELGIRRNQLYQWKEKTDKQGGSTFPGSGRRLSSGTQPEEISMLKRELERVKEGNNEK
jgi:transposase